MRIAEFDLRSFTVIAILTLSLITSLLDGIFGTKLSSTHNLFAFSGSILLMSVVLIYS